MEIKELNKYRLSNFKNDDIEKILKENNDVSLMIFCIDSMKMFILPNIHHCELGENRLTLYDRNNDECWIRARNIFICPNNVINDIMQKIRVEKMYICTSYDAYKIPKEFLKLMGEICI